MNNGLRIARRLPGVSTFLFTLLIVGSQAWAAGDTLTVAISPDIPPYVMKHATYGLEVALMHGALPGRKLRFIQLPYAQLQTAIQQKRADVSVGVREGIDADDSGVYFSDEFVTFVNFAISKKSAHMTIDSVADLAGHRILTWEDAYQDLGDAFKAMYAPGAPQRKNYQEFANQRQQVIAFWKGQNVVCVIDGSIFRYFSLQMGYPLDQVDYHAIFPPTTKFRVAFGNAALRNGFNAQLKKLHDNGQYQQVLERFHAEPVDD